MSTMPRYQAWLMLFMILGGGAIAAVATQEPHHQAVQGETVNQHEVTWNTDKAEQHLFFTTYLDVISGRAKPADTCEAHTLEELLLPCETNR